MRIKEFRESKNLTTIELGKILGVVPSAITNWETGTRRPNVEMLVKLTEVFGCTADELLGIEKKPVNRESGQAVPE